MEINCDNYADWSARIKNYADWNARIKKSLLAQGLCDIIETTIEPPKPEDDVVEFEAWRKRNNDALLAIQSSCGIDILSQINNISSAKIVWDKLDEMFKQPWEGIHPHTPKRSTTSANQMVEEEKSPSNPGRGMDAERAALFKTAVRRGDWSAISYFLDHDLYGDACFTERITLTGGTVLHAAVAAQKQNIVEKLVNKMSEHDLAIQDDKGYTALHETIYGDNFRMAEFLITKNNSLIRIRTVSKDLPVIMAMRCGHKKLASYLYSLTPLGDLEAEQGHQGSALLTYAIYARHFVPQDILLAFWRSAFRYLLKLNPRIERLILRRSKLFNFLERFLPEDLRRLRAIELENGRFQQLLSRICRKIPTFNPSQLDRIIAPAIFCAISRGNFEFVSRMLKANPEFLWARNSEGMSIFHYAVLHRQAQIFSLIYGLKGRVEGLLAERDKSGNTILHLAGMLTEHTVVDKITGAALQMEREVEWFKEVESICQPISKELLNDEGLNPRQVFRMTHQNLREGGERWMKETTTSGLVAATLIVTIMFTAAFTFPGGNDQDTGLPVLVNDTQFRIFVVTISLSLFSSLTSVLMFLNIFTSRYAEEDFLKLLPRKMMIGFFTLLFSIGTMMTGFCLALTLLLRGQISILIPIILLAVFPLYIFLQTFLPVLTKAVLGSSFGPSIFDKKMKPLF